MCPKTRFDRSSVFMCTKHTPEVYFKSLLCVVCVQDSALLNTRSVQWETGEVLKIACTTDVVVCWVCEGGDLELPIGGVGTPAVRIGTWETVRQNGGALATVY